MIKDNYLLENKKFYVHNLRADQPGQEFDNFEVASQKAQHISRLNPDVEILVLQSVVGFIFPSNGMITKKYL
jgi:hypothetical protein